MPNYAVINVMGMRFGAFALLAVVILLFGCLGGGQPAQEPKPNTIDVKQVILFRNDTPVTISAQLPVNLSTYELKQKTAENEAKVNVTFAIPVIVSTGPDKQIYNAKLRLRYSTDYVKIIYPYYANGVPLNRNFGGVYELDNQIPPSTKIQIFLIGRADTIPEMVRYVGVEYTVDLLNENKTNVTSVTDVIRITK